MFYHSSAAPSSSCILYFPIWHALSLLTESHFPRQDRFSLSLGPPCADVSLTSPLSQHPLPDLFLHRKNFPHHWGLSPLVGYPGGSWTSFGILSHYCNYLMDGLMLFSLLQWSLVPFPGQLFFFFFFNLFKPSSNVATLGKAFLISQAIPYSLFTAPMEIHAEPFLSQQILLLKIRTSLQRTFHNVPQKDILFCGNAENDGKIQILKYFGTKINART